jgi:hypothetical protein
MGVLLMNVQRIDFEHGQPTGVVVEMTIEEAAQIAKWSGNPKASQIPTTEVSDVYRALTRMVFNPHWSDGLDGYLNGAQE